MTNNREQVRETIRETDRHRETEVREFRGGEDRTREGKTDREKI